MEVKKRVLEHPRRIVPSAGPRCDERQHSHISPRHEDAEAHKRRTSAAQRGGFGRVWATRQPRFYAENGRRRGQMAPSDTP